MTVDSVGHKKPSPRFLSFLADSRENPEVQAASSRIGQSE